MKVLGLGSPGFHRPAAALVVDGEVVAAVEEQLITRRSEGLPVEAARYCLAEAGLRVDELDHVAVAWSPETHRHDLPAYLRRGWRSQPKRVWEEIRGTRRRKIDQEQAVSQVIAALTPKGLDPKTPPITWVDHHVSLAANSYYLSGWDNAAILSLDDDRGLVSTLLAEGRYGEIVTVRRVSNPDSIPLLLGTVSEFLGFDRADADLLRGLAAYGDAGGADLSPLVDQSGDFPFRIRNLRSLNTTHLPGQKRTSFHPELTRWLGPPANGNVFLERYCDLAAATLETLEAVIAKLLDTTLRPALEFGGGRLCLSGPCSLNPRLAQKLLEHELVESIWVPPAADDSGAPLGAALWASHQLGTKILPLRHPYLGPSYGNQEITETLHRLRVPHLRLEHDLFDRVAELLAQGKVVGWFQGRTEIGPRALGNRCVLADPARAGATEEINERIKKRESWYRYTPMIQTEMASTLLGHVPVSAYGTLTVPCHMDWRGPLQEALRPDGTCDPQVVSDEFNPRLHRLLECFRQRTGTPGLLAASLCRPDEPLACSPEHALSTFFGSGLDFLAIGNHLVAKAPDGLASRTS